MRSFGRLAVIIALAMWVPMHLRASPGIEPGMDVQTVRTEENSTGMSKVVSGPERELPQYVPGEVILSLRSSSGGDVGAQSVLAGLARRHGLAETDLVVRKPGHPKWRAVYKALLPPGVSPPDACKRLSADPDVEWAEPNYYRYVQRTPNDTYYASQEYLATIGAPAAWDITTGSSSVVIAVIDTGVYWNHDDLRSNVRMNPGETWDYVDNDGNGFVDDIRGWDFVSVASNLVAQGEDPGPRDNNPTDWHGHGTHVAGIAGAVGNNLRGVTGVCWNVSIMPLRAGYKDKSGNGVLEIADIAAALMYAADNGAHIVNMSFGSANASHTEKLAIDYCDAAGLLLIAAAGNQGTDQPFYPAAFDNVLAVTSVNSARQRSYFSDFGLWVDLAAPGESVYSTTVDASVYDYKSGTSMASPVVAGVAGLIKAAYPSLTAREIALRLRSAAEDVNTLNRNYASLLGTGLVRADAALSAGAPAARLATVSLWAEESSGASDGDFDPGETLILRPSVRNSGLEQGVVSVSLTTDDPYVSVTDGLSEIGTIPEDRTVTSWNDTLSIAIAADVPPDHMAGLTLRTIAGNSVVLATNVVPLRLNPVLRNPLMLAKHVAAGYRDPTIVKKAGGGVVVVYQLTGQVSNCVLARTADASGNWTPAMQISPTSGVTAARDQSGALGADGRVHVSFMGVTAYPQCELFYTSQSPVDGTWAEPVRLTNGASLIETGGYRHSTIGVDPQGRPHVVWGDRRNGTQIFHMYHDGTAWSAQTPIATPSADPADYKLVFDQEGVGYLLWAQPSEYRIYMMTLTDGVWSAPTLVTQTQTDAQNYHNAYDVALDSQGRLHLAYLWPYASYVSYRRYDAGAWSQAAEIAPRIGVSGPGPAIAIAPGDLPHIVRRAAPTYAQGDPVQLHETHFNGTSWTPIAPLTFDRVGAGILDLDFDIESDGTLLVACQRDPTPGDGMSISWETDMYLLSSRRDPARLPSRPLVQDDDWWTAGDTSLHASWSSSHAGGIAEYEYAVGTVPGEADVRWWNSALTAVNATIDMTDTPLLDGQVYYLSVRARGNNGYTSPIGCSDGIRYIPPASTIRDARAAPDTIAADIRSAIVTAAFSDCFYIESEDRSAGIRVEHPGHGLSEGMRADVAGVLDTNSDCERCIQASSASPVGSGSVEPLGLISRGIGGWAFGYDAGSGAGQQGVDDGTGLNNIGLLVRTWGKITRTGTGCLYVDDGSSLEDGTEGNTGILVECDPTGFAPGDSVEITGISSCFRTPDGTVARRILTRGTGDVRRIER